MIESVINLLFRCLHRRLTRPITLMSRTRKAQGGSYVVCLDCGTEFEYDLKEMRIGKAIPQPPDSPEAA